MKSIFVLPFLLFCFFAPAQYASVSFTNISLNQGLSQSSVVDVSFDKNGFVWMATQDGLNRFDGKDFVVFDKKFDDITSGSASRLGKIIAGDNDVLWIISMGGHLEKFNLIDQHFEPLNISPAKNRLVVTCLLADTNERLWIGTENGKVIQYDDKTNKIIQEINIPPTSRHQSINALFKDSKQQIWVIGNKIGVIKNNKIVYDSVSATERLKSEISFSSMTEDKAGNLWLGSLGQGLFVKTQNQPFHQFMSNGIPLPADLVVEDILADDEGKIWIGTYGKGLFIINEKEKTIRQLINDKRNPFSLGFNDVLTIKQDRNKGIWIGTDGGGVSYYNKRKNNFILFSNQTVPYNIEIAPVRSITTDKKGTIWVGTSNKGLTKINYQNGEYKTWHFPSYKKNISNPNRIVSLFADSEGVLWLGTQGNGLMILILKKKKP